MIFVLGVNLYGCNSKSSYKHNEAIGDFENLQSALNYSSTVYLPNSETFKEMTKSLNNIFGKSKGFLKDKEWKIKAPESYPQDTNYFTFFAYLHDKNKSSVYNKEPILVLTVSFQKEKGNLLCNQNMNIYKDFKSRHSFGSSHTICVNYLNLNCLIIEYPGDKTYYSKAEKIGIEVLKSFNYELLEKIKPPVKAKKK